MLIGGGGGGGGGGGKVVKLITSKKVDEVISVGISDLIVFSISVDLK